MAVVVQEGAAAENKKAVVYSLSIYSTVDLLFLLRYPLYLRSRSTLKKRNGFERFRLYQLVPYLLVVRVAHAAGRWIIPIFLLPIIVLALILFVCFRVGASCAAICCQVHGVYLSLVTTCRLPSRLTSNPLHKLGRGG